MLDFFALLAGAYFTILAVFIVYEWYAEREQDKLWPVHWKSLDAVDQSMIQTIYTIIEKDIYGK